VLKAAVAGLVFGVFEGDSTGALKVTFVRFEKSDDDKARLAVLVVTNRSERDYFIFTGRKAECTYSITSDRTWGSPYCKIVPRSSTGSLAPKEATEALGGQWVLPASSEFQLIVRLPEDGQQGHVALYCERLPKKLPRRLSEARELIWKVYDPPYKPAWAMSDEEIQCPKRLPDGTVEPPRLLSKRGAKP